ncbi:hypothetical protein [Ahrensia marina]|uniref:Uncharacterized protein n=1 Tax=Ahrensia marina TaxID=1514904 RepID=A0A0M9GNM4_9HYPH|nr:hypothetical protein [Ahrensia marina]KPB02033.1 hypothetical protein SU32_04485 [Ahrensia marina]
MPRTVETEVEARQGRKGMPVLKVLLIAIGLALAVWFGVELIFSDSQTGGMVPNENVQSETQSN